MTYKFPLTLLAGIATSLATGAIAEPVAATGSASCDTSIGTPRITLNQQQWLEVHSKYFLSGEDALQQCQQAADALQAAHNNNQAKYLVAEGHQICLRGDRQSGCQGGPENGVYKLFEVKAGANSQLTLLNMLDRQPYRKDIHRTLGIMYIPLPEDSNPQASGTSNREQEDSNPQTPDTLKGCLTLGIMYLPCP